MLEWALRRTIFCWVALRSQLLLLGLRCLQFANTQGSLSPVARLPGVRDATRRAPFTLQRTTSCAWHLPCSLSACILVSLVSLILERPLHETTSRDTFTNCRGTRDTRIQGKDAALNQPQTKQLGSCRGLRVPCSCSFMPPTLAGAPPCARLRAPARRMTRVGRPRARALHGIARGVWVRARSLRVPRVAGRLHRGVLCPPLTTRPQPPGRPPLCLDAPRRSSV